VGKHPYMGYSLSKNAVGVFTDMQLAPMGKDLGVNFTREEQQQWLTDFVEDPNNYDDNGDLQLFKLRLSKESQNIINNWEKAMGPNNLNALLKGELLINMPISPEVLKYPWMITMQPSKRGTKGADYYNDDFDWDQVITHEVGHIFNTKKSPLWIDEYPELYITNLDEEWDGTNTGELKEGQYKNFLIDFFGEDLMSGSHSGEVPEISSARAEIEDQLLEQNVWNHYDNEFGPDEFNTMMTSLWRPTTDATTSNEYVHHLKHFGYYDLIDDLEILKFHTSKFDFINTKEESFRNADLMVQVRSINKDLIKHTDYNEASEFINTWNKETGRKRKKFQIQSVQNAQTIVKAYQSAGKDSSYNKKQYDNALQFLTDFNVHFQPQWIEKNITFQKEEHTKLIEEKTKNINNLKNRVYENLEIYFNEFTDSDTDMQNENVTQRAKTGGVVEFQTEGVIKEKETETENITSLEKPGENASASEKRDYWLNLNSNKNFVQRILNPSLNVGREIPHPTKGTLMTHYMTSVEIDGKHLVIPTVVDTGEDKLVFINDIDQAIQYAMQSGEYIITDTAEEAEWLANENYKTDKFIRAYGPTGPAKKQKGGWVHMPKYNTSHQKIRSYQVGGEVKSPYTSNTNSVRLSGNSIFTDMEDKDLLEALINKVVGDRRGDVSQEDAIERLVTLFDFTARRESHYNPVKNKNGTLEYNPTGYSNETTQKNPALSLYMFKHWPPVWDEKKKEWKHSPLQTTINRVKGYIGSNFMKEAEEIGFIDRKAKAGSKFNPYWFVELQEHMDPRKLTKSQLDILLLLDYAHGNADLTGYLQGDMTPVEFYSKYHHKGAKEKLLSEEVKKVTKEQTDANWIQFLEEDKKGHFDEYWKFLYD